MANKLLIITESHQSLSSPAGWHDLPRFWTQLPQSKNQSDQLIRAAWYNIDLETWNPSILDMPACVEHRSIETSQIEFKIPTTRPIVMFEHDHPEYLKRLEYCRENNITITVEIIPVDGHWNRVSLKL